MAKSNDGSTPVIADAAVPAAPIVVHSGIDPEHYKKLLAAQRRMLTWINDGQPGHLRVSVVEESQAALTESDSP